MQPDVPSQYRDGKARYFGHPPLQQRRTFCRLLENKLNLRSGRRPPKKRRKPCLHLQSGLRLNNGGGGNRTRVPRCFRGRFYVRSRLFDLAQEPPIDGMLTEPAKNGF